MRSTRAAAAVARLNQRRPAHHYTMAKTSLGTFVLMRTDQTVSARAEAVCQPLDLDDFVAFVNAIDPEQKVRRSRNDIAFEQQLDRLRGKPDVSQE